MIKTIIFDLGNVILDFDHHIITRRLSSISGLDEKRLYDLIFSSGIVDSFEEGRIKPEDFFKEVIRRSNNIDIDFEGFKSIWNDIFSPPKVEISQLLNRLKMDYRLYLLSNTNILHFEYIKERFKILEIFEGYILSYRLGFRKPDPRIWLEAIKESRSKPEMCIYIDDIKEFVEVACKLGINGIHFEGALKLKERLKDYGLL